MQMLTFQSIWTNPNRCGKITKSYFPWLNAAGKRAAPVRLQGEVGFIPTGATGKTVRFVPCVGPLRLVVQDVRFSS